MTEQPTKRSRGWSAHPNLKGIVPPAEPYQPPARPRPTRERWAHMNRVGASTMIGADEELVTVKARPYSDETPPAHRRSCQHDGPPGPDCPGCIEIDELLTIAHANAAPMPPGHAADHGLRTAAEASAELLGRERPPAQPPAIVEPEPGLLARALRRLFG